jgi:hypothetical protein
MVETLAKMKSEADKLGVAQWKQLRAVRREVSAVIKAIEAR